MTGFGIFLLITGIACMVVAFVLLVFDLLRFRRAEGYVCGNDWSDDEGGLMYAPQVRFRTQDGIDRVFQSAVYIHRQPIKQGTSIPVRYHPSFAWLNGIDRLTCRFLPIGFFVLCGIVFIWASTLT